MDSRRLLTDLARQMYADLRYITGLNPVNIVDDDTTIAFNHLLKEARTAFPGHPLLEGLRDMTPRNIKYKDAAVVAGQLAGFLQLMTARDARIAALMGEEGAPHAEAPASEHATSSRFPRPQGRTNNTESAAPASQEDELYGPVNPSVRRNDDGTIPFSLD